MGNTNIKDLVSKLDMIQQGVWSTEEETIKNSGNIAKQKADIKEIKTLLNLVNEKLDKLDVEMRGLRNGNEA